ncbi:MAG: transposase zinc-binding domain-containing protein [Vicinamibacterales bacterium]|nr:transposase zinc-binding domain-containing protein [Vicinamibacterales bacterium]
MEQEFREFLGCGVLARGFARFRCDDCGLNRPVPFSCKGRGFCPSCGGRQSGVQGAGGKQRQELEPGPDHLQGAALRALHQSRLTPPSECENDDEQEQGSRCKRRCDAMWHEVDQGDAVRPQACDLDAGIDRLPDQ